MIIEAPSLNFFFLSFNVQKGYSYHDRWPGSVSLQHCVVGELIKIVLWILWKAWKSLVYLAPRAQQRDHKGNVVAYKYSWSHIKGTRNAQWNDEKREFKQIKENRSVREQTHRNIPSYLLWTLYQKLVQPRFVHWRYLSLFFWGPLHWPSFLSVSAAAPSCVQ